MRHFLLILLRTAQFAPPPPSKQSGLINSETERPEVETNRCCVFPFLRSSGGVKVKRSWSSAWAEKRNKQLLLVSTSDRQKCVNIDFFFLSVFIEHSNPVESQIRWRVGFGESEPWSKILPAGSRKKVFSEFFFELQKKFFFLSGPTLIIFFFLYSTISPCNIVVNSFLMLGF